MKFDYVVNYLSGGIHSHPEDKKTELEKAIEILRDGQGYLTKGYPTRINFYSDFEEE